MSPLRFIRSWFDIRPEDAKRALAISFLAMLAGMAFPALALAQAAPALNINLGTGAGLILGFVFLYFRQPIVHLAEIVTGQNLWDPSIRFLTELPSRSDPIEITVICIMALVFSFLATLYPAFRAASTDPVQVLRYE